MFIFSSNFFFLFLVFLVFIFYFYKKYRVFQLGTIHYLQIPVFCTNLQYREHILLYCFISSNLKFYLKIWKNKTLNKMILAKLDCYCCFPFFWKGILFYFVPTKWLFWILFRKNTFFLPYFTHSQQYQFNTIHFFIYFLIKYNIKKLTK